MRTIYLVLKEDIIFYPPVLTIINILLELRYKVVHIGVYSDNQQKKILEAKGAVFISTVKYEGKGSLLKKLYQQILFKRQVVSYLKRSDIGISDYLWIFQTETICLLDNLISKYNTIIQQFEFDEPSLNWKYKILNPRFDMGKALQQAKKVVSCEYNRAQITKGLFKLNKLPIVLPNKPYINENYDIPTEIAESIKEIKSKIKDKVVLIYQGVFLPERNLEDFCVAINNLPENYILIMMGKHSELFEYLKKHYESEKIMFIPFIKPPYHLLVTKLADIGILSYIPSSNSVSGVINSLYCAPNKIFEYAKYGIPMISNDIPRLHYTFMEYGCGETIDNISPESINLIVNRILDSYKLYSDNAIKYYDTVNTKDIILSIIEK